MSSTEVTNANGPAAGYTPRLLLKYRQEVAPALREKFAYANVMQIPRLQKITLNMGVGEASRDIKELDAAEKELMIISGQKPRLTRARRAISTFKIREGMPVGCFVTLRGARMWEFMDRLVHVALPRVRDFRGIPGKSFDGRGNYSMGVREHLIFLELDYSQISRNRGLDITFVTSAKTDAESKELLRLLGMPFRN
ncbi:MAG: 50S ribosomal protein L5 [Candidatus Sumerlaeia bacterium]|nr:50S ribosomal protein L5 [Candidatus Sumerlaeia bacterium]